MKNKILLASIICLLVFVGCFDDEGNYTYTKLEEPTWTQNAAISSAFRQGGTATFRASNHFVWPEADSARRASEVTYEWKFGDVVVSTELDFSIPADSLIAMLGITTFDGTIGHEAIFSIKEKATGVSYMKQVYYYVYPRFADGDWYVLSEKDGKAKLSFIARKTKDGKQVYELTDDFYAEMNGGETLQGGAVGLEYANEARHISSLGALEIITTENRYEVDVVSGKLEGHMEYIPFSGEIRDRHDALTVPGSYDNYGTGTHTYLLDSQGQLYRRMMTANHFAGEFGEVPMYLDTKGYEISSFGRTAYGWMQIPCYDEKNRRVLSIIYYSTGEIVGEGWNADYDVEYKMSKLCSSAPSGIVEITGCAPVWNMPEGTEVLDICNARTDWSSTQGHTTMVYNNANGETYVTRFMLDTETGAVMNWANNTDRVFPGGNLTKDSKFTSSANTWVSPSRGQMLVYSHGSTVSYIDLNAWTNHTLLKLEDEEDKITSLAWCLESATWGSYRRLMVGTEKGFIHFYDLANLNNPVITGTVEVGGRIVAAKELVAGRGDTDKY